jgi:hypothetical protein
MADSLATLRSAGFAVDRMPQEQQRVLGGLSDDEISVLTSIKEKLDAAGGDVEAHRVADDTGVIFW